MATSHTVEQLTQELYKFISADLNKVLHIEHNSISLGNGQWGIEIKAYDAETDRSDLITTFTGSNGTRSESDDLWAMLEEAEREAYDMIQNDLKNEADLNALENQGYEG